MERKTFGDVLNRGVHNFYKDLAHQLKLPLKTFANEGHGATKLEKLQSGGVWELDNELEAKLYPNRPTSPAKLSIETQDVYLWKIENAYITSETAYPFTSRGELFTVSSDVQRTLSSTAKIIRRPMPLFAKRIRTPLLHFSGANHENKGHFMGQFLPRLVACLPFLKAHPETKILLAPGHKRWQSKYFEVFGIGSERLIEGGYGTWRVDTLYYPPMLYFSSPLSSPSSYRQISQTITQGLPELPDAEKKVLFITRDDAPDRKAFNEKEFIDLLTKYYPNTQKVTLSGMSLKDQVALFSQAKLVVGLHGQGLSNVLFTRQATLINLWEPSKDIGWWQAFNQFAIMNGGRGVCVDVKPRWEGKNFWGDTGEFERALEALTQDKAAIKRA